MPACWTKSADGVVVGAVALVEDDGDLHAAAVGVDQCLGDRRRGERIGLHQNHLLRRVDLGHHGLGAAAIGREVASSGRPAGHGPAGSDGPRKTVRRARRSRQSMSAGSYTTPFVVVESERFLRAPRAKRPGPNPAGPARGAGIMAISGPGARREIWPRGGRDKEAGGRSSMLLATRRKKTGRAQVSGLGTPQRIR